MLKARIGHHRADDATAAQLFRSAPAFANEGENLIAIDDAATFIRPEVMFTW